MSARIWAFPINHCYYSLGNICEVKTLIGSKDHYTVLVGYPRRRRKGEGRFGLAVSVS